MSRYAGVLDLYEEEILNAPFVEYTRENPPSLLRAVVDGVKFNLSEGNI